MKYNFIQRDAKRFGFFGSFGIDVCVAIAGSALGSVCV